MKGGVVMNSTRIRQTGVACQARRSAAVLAILGLVALATDALAFDTGPHFDITEDVLRSEEFMPQAIKTAQCANFMVDFYEFIAKVPA
jgi:hypothetical protein